MNGARLVLRGLSDTFEHLVYFIMMTVAWWGSMLLILPFPAATMALFAHADPRHGTSTDRPTFGETLQLIRRNLFPAWRFALLIWPVMLLLFYNIFYYYGSGSILGILAPFWVALFLIAFAISCTIFAMAAMEERGAVETAKTASLMVIARLPQVALLIVVLAPVLFLSLVLVVPLALFIPMTVAAIFNRFVLVNRKIDIPDPLQPTAERLAEPEVHGRRRWIK